MTVPAVVHPGGIYEQVKDDLGYLKLTRAAEVFAALAEQAGAEGWSHVEYLAAVTAAEAAATRDRRLAARIRFAHLPARRSLDEFDFEFQPSIDRKLIYDLASCRFITEGRPVIFLGQPGTGKSHLASALCAAAVTAGYRGFFTTAADLVANMAAAYADGSFGSHRALRAGHRRRRPGRLRPQPGQRPVPSHQPSLRERQLHDCDHQQVAAWLGRALRR
jgi:DNA replication protein DnaC